MSGALCLTLLLAQSLPTEAGDAAQLDRMRRELSEAPAIVVSQPLRREGLVFRVTIQGRRPDKPVWEDLPRSHHFQFLQQVRPGALRGGTLFTIRVPVGSLVQSLARQVRESNHKAGARRAAQEVRRELEDFLSCRAQPSKPGC